MNIILNLYHPLNSVMGVEFRLEHISKTSYIYRNIFMNIYLLNRFL